MEFMYSFISAQALFSPRPLFGATWIHSYTRMASFIRMRQSTVTHSQCTFGYKFGYNYITVLSSFSQCRCTTGTQLLYLTDLSKLSKPGSLYIMARLECESLDSQIQLEASNTSRKHSMIKYLASARLNFLLTWPTGYNFPSFSCNNTAATPTPNASVLRTKGFIRPGSFNTGSCSRYSPVPNYIELHSSKPKNDQLILTGLSRFFL